MRVLRGCLLGLGLLLAGVLCAGAPAWASGASGVFGPAVVPALSGEPPVVSTEAASGVGEAAATLNGTVNPEGEAIVDCHFAYVAEAQYQPEAPEPYVEGATVPCGSTPSGSEPVAVSAEVPGLTAVTSYHFELFASNASAQGVGGDQMFRTPGFARIEGTSVAGVGAAQAIVRAQIDPFGLSGSYRVQYGPNEAYGSETAEVELPGVEEPVAVSVKLTGLTPGSEYHVRMVATNAQGSEHGADVAFRTLSVGVQGLPDKRMYEMVTPVNNQNAQVYVPRALGFLYSEDQSDGIETERMFQASAIGNKVAYVAEPTSGGNGQSRVKTGNEYLAARSLGGGWTQVNIQPEGKGGSQAGSSTLYQGLSSDLSSGVLRSGSPVESEPLPLSPEAPGEGYNVLYKHVFDETAYQPLFTTSPRPLGPREFGAPGVQNSSLSGNAQSSEIAYAGSSADFSRLLFEANGALTADAVSPPVQAVNNLYESVAGRLSLVNVLPDGVAEANATFGAPPTVANRRPDFSHVVSEDGTRVFWTDLNTHMLYVNEGVGSSAARIMQVDASQGGPAGSGGGGRFWTASSDGSKVFFTDCSPLTADSTAVAGDCEPGGGTLAGSDLYEYDVTNDHLSDLTVDANASDPLGADVQGVVGASNDGEYVYFAANGVLAAGASAGQPNLYLRHAGVTTFVASLSQQDGEHVAPFATSLCPEGCLFGDWQPGVGVRTAEVTPGGHSVLFMSNQSLGTYPDGRGYPNQGLEEVYVYDAGTGHLLCVSCSPTGEAPPTSQEGAAAFVPISWSNTYLPQWISDDGSRVFFDSAVPLVPQDTNGVQDVYEWERDGTESCREAAGCDYLLSSGTSQHWSWLTGMSANGNDVFIATDSELAPQDRNENYDLYDARVEGTPPSSPGECVGGCQGSPPAIPVLGTPASMGAAGPGNLPPAPTVSPRVSPRGLTNAQKLARALAVCRRDRQRHTRAVCEARARKRYGARSRAKKSAKGRS